MDAMEKLNQLNLTDVFDHLKTPTMILDRDLRFVFANQAYLDMTETDSASVLGEFVFDVFKEGDERVSKITQIFQAALDGETTYLDAQPYDFSYGEVTDDIRYWRAVQEPLRLADGRIGFMLQQAHDVTASVLADLEREMISAELDHRTKNVLAVVQSITRLASRQYEDKQGFTDDLMGRLAAMNRTHSRLHANDFEDMSLTDLIRDEVSTMALDSNFTLSGDAIPISSRVAKDLSMIIHELATNAAKHGCFAGDLGQLNVSWTRDGDKVYIEWQETGVGHLPPLADTGFGSKLLRMIRTVDCQRSMSQDGMTAKLSFTAE